MTISNEAIKVTVQGNGVQTTFNYSFLIPNQDTADLYLTDLDSGAVTLLSKSSWLLSGANNPAGGTFTYPRTAGGGVQPISNRQTLTLVRAVPNTQQTSIRNQSGFYPQSIESALDWIVMQVQQLASEVNRAVRFGPTSDALPDLPTTPGADLANALIGFDAAGNLSVLKGQITGTPVSPFGALLVAEVSAALARQRLGFTTVGSALVTAGNETAAQAALGGTATGRAVFTAPDGAAVQNAILPGLWTDVASAATTDLGFVNSENLRITGTTTITAFGTAASGTRRQLRFAGALVLTHNATSLILPGAANITTAAGDTAVAVSLGAGNWVVVEYQRAEAAPIPAGSFLRNRLINGGMAVDQRNAGGAQTFTAGAALAYSVDRWYGYSTGANVTGQRVAGAVASTFRYQFTGAASVTVIGFGQRMEALNTADLAGQTCTLAVDLANSLLTTVTWTAFYANTTDTFGTLASPTRTQIATGTFTVTGTVTRYSANINVPAAATTGIEIVFTVGAQTSGTWTIGNAQLEVGSAATPFERRQSGQELALCQRYWQKTFPLGTVPVSNSGAAGAVHGSSSVDNISFSVTRSFLVQMRAPPTMVFFSPDQAGSNWSAQTGLVPTLTDLGATDSSVSLRATGSIMAGGAHSIHFTANAEL